MKKQHVKRHNMPRAYYDKRARLCMLLYEKPLIQFLEGNNKIRDVDAEDINLSFAWRKTKEGWGFWAGLHCIMNTEFDFGIGNEEDQTVI